MSCFTANCMQKTCSAFILHGYNKETKEFNLDDEIVMGSMFTHNGKLLMKELKMLLKELINGYNYNNNICISYICWF